MNLRSKDGIRVLWRRDHIICKIVRKKRKGIKYNIKDPKWWQRLVVLIRRTTILFGRIIYQKNEKKSIAFSILDEKSTPPVWYKHVRWRVIFDVNIDFTRKAWWLAVGHKTPDPIMSTCVGVVSKESVRIAFTYAALNNLDVFYCGYSERLSAGTLFREVLRYLWYRLGARIVR